MTFTRVCPPLHHVIKVCVVKLIVYRTGHRKKEDLHYKLDFSLTHSLSTDTFLFRSLHYYDLCLNAHNISKEIKAIMSQN